MTFAQYVQTTIGVFGSVVIPALFTLAFLFFVYGIVKYFFLSGDSTKRTEAHSFVLWGVLGMVLLFSVWGLIHLLLVTFGIS
ncbi:hypothetical protein MNBD_CPR01-163 [hydrothermal vent metagenome]|uniref:Uncharacterized protein n=1 Tax=hydrothermal vent metagenome TaxID=652676 RepID=A0A3B0VM97_9ZZZZ